MKKTTLFFLAFILVIVGAIIALTKNVRPFNREKELIAVKTTINTSISWAKDKDLDLLYSVIANDSNYTEIQPGDKVVRGIDEFKEREVFFKDDNFRAVNYEIWDMRINFSQDGTVAWWYCMLNDINTWKGQPANWENVRWTGVLEKRKGAWVICQMHFSNSNE